MGVKITATGHYLPPHVVTNDDLTVFMDTSDEWIQKRTGISQRHIAINENTSDLAAEAAKRILASRNMDAAELDFILVATMTPDAQSPSTACKVQEKIGATKAFCFDMNAACSGFIFALSTAMHVMQSGSYQKGLVLGAETMSKIINWQDRSTAVLFGDGAGGVLLEQSAQNYFLAEDLHSDGTRYMSLTADEKAVLHPFQSDAPKGNQYLSMDGRGIFDFVSRNVPETIHQVLEKAACKKEDVSWVIAHQANRRLLEVLSKKVKIPLEKFATNIAQTGNTSAASVPILLDQMIQEGTIQIGSGETILLTGFGGGLTWGSIMMDI